MDIMKRSKPLGGKGHCGEGESRDVRGEKREARSEILEPKPAPSYRGDKRREARAERGTYNKEIRKDNLKNTLKFILFPSSFPCDSGGEAVPHRQ